MAPCAKEAELTSANVDLRMGPVLPFASNDMDNRTPDLSTNNDDEDSAHEEAKGKSKGDGASSEKCIGVDDEGGSGK